MKLVHPDIQQVIEFKTDYFNSLVIENQTFLLELLRDIQQQIRGEPGKIVLSVDDVPVEIGNHLDLLIDFVEFDGNKKGLITKVIHVLEKTAQDEVHFMETQKLLAKVEQFLNELSYDQEVDLVYEKLSLVTLLKAVGIRLVIDYTRLVDQIYAYMELVNRFEGDRLFVCLNLRSFVKDEDLQQLVDMVLLHGMKLLLIDSHVYTLLPKENRLLIDKDLCEM